MNSKCSILFQTLAIHFQYVFWAEVYDFNMDRQGTNSSETTSKSGKPTRFEIFRDYLVSIKSIEQILGLKSSPYFSTLAVASMWNV